MSGITRIVNMAMVLLFTGCIASGAIAGEPRQRKGDSMLNGVRARGPDEGSSSRAVLSPKEIDRLLADIQSRCRGGVLVVECSGAYGYTTIQSAIDAAVDGDTIVVLPNDCEAFGCYYERIDFLGKAITVQSAQPTNPDVVAATIISGARTPTSTKSVVDFHAGEGADSILDGLTITGGNPRSGVRCRYSSPTLVHCTISGNQSQFEGGGLTCLSAGPTLLNCTIRDNTILGSSPAGQGGGIACSGSSSPTLTDCVISDNSTAGSGGGLFCDGLSIPTLTNCRISGNKARDGGGMFAIAADPVLVNCIISDNFAFAHSGGIHLESAYATLTNCTISANRALNDGGGLYSLSSSPAMLTNCILWGNLPQEVYVEEDVSPTLTYCDVQGGWEGEGNIDVDPQFAFADDLRLMNNSLCIDAGTNTPSGGLPGHDADGNPRPLDGDGDSAAVADIGAYEFNRDAPMIAVSPPVVEMLVSEEDGSGSPLTLSIRNTGAGTLHWTVASDADWLQADPQQGESMGEVDIVTLNANPEALAPGFYFATLTISDSDVPPHYGSATVAVRMYVPRVLHVPAEYSTIQAAIDAATWSGDTVMVADGTYTGNGNKNLDFGGKEITLRSESNNPALCIIDCENSGRGFYFHNCETTATQVSGFTVKNGWDNAGAAIHCASISSPTLHRCRFIVNKGEASVVLSRGGCLHCTDYSSPTLIDCFIDNCLGYYGGGVYCEGSSAPTLQDCTISNCTASHGGALFCTDSAAPTLNACVITANYGTAGGGVYCLDGAYAALVGCTLTFNDAMSGGGGACAENASMNLSGCTIESNRVSLDGGGLYCASSNVVVRDCAIRDNWSGDVGGGLSATASTLRMSGCVLAGNKSNNVGGGVCLRDACAATLGSCAILQNVAPHDGGGIYCTESSDATINNCTIIDNQSIGDSGALACNNAGVTLTNSILWDNRPRSIHVEAGDSPVASYCDIAGGYAGVGNLDVDPGFAIADDFHLAPDSPCIDAGTNTPPGGLTDTDIDGGARSIDGDRDSVVVADIGVHEFNPDAPIIAVDRTHIEFVAWEGQAGEAPQVLTIYNVGGVSLEWSLNWQADWLHADIRQGESTGEADVVTLTADAAGLQAGAYTTTLSVDAPYALNHPRNIAVTLYVGKAFNVPSEYATIQAAIDAASRRGDVVVVADGVYTGQGNKRILLNSKPITLRSESGDPTLCVIDCEGDGRGMSITGSGSIFTRIEGLTIRNGRESNAGGIHCAHASPTISDCIIRDCRVSAAGGGIALYDSRARLHRCTIANNHAARAGGIYCELWATPELHDCIIEGNEAESGYGGGIGCRFLKVSIALERCSISRNTSTGAGAGVYLDMQPDQFCSLTACIISGNQSGAEGGGLWLAEGEALLENCLITGNTATSGAGVLCENPYHMAFGNCTLADNAASQGGGAIACPGATVFVMDNCILWGDTPNEVQLSSAGSATLSYCDIQGGWTGDGANNIDSDPLFIDADGPDDVPGTADDDLRLQLASPCIDAGDSDYWTGDGATDLAGSPRIMGCGVDLGAYEFIAGAQGSGDLDGNGMLDVDDLALFVHGLLNNSNLVACVADMNGDDRIDGRDIQLYTEVLLAP